MDQATAPALLQYAAAASLTPKQTHPIRSSYVDPRVLGTDGFALIVSNVIDGQVLPPANDVWLALRPLDALIASKIATGEAPVGKHTLRRRMHFIVLLARVWAATQSQWATMVDGIQVDDDGGPRWPTPESWRTVLDALVKGSTRGSFPTQCLVSMQTDRPRFLLEWHDATITAATLQSLIADFLFAALDEDCDTWLLGGSFECLLSKSDAAAVHDMRVVEFGLAFDAIQVTGQFVRDLFTTLASFDCNQRTRYLHPRRRRITFQCKAMIFRDKCIFEDAAVVELTTCLHSTRHVKLDTLSLPTMRHCQSAVLRQWFPQFITQRQSPSHPLRRFVCGDDFELLSDAIRLGEAIQEIDITVHPSNVWKLAEWLPRTFFSPTSSSRVPKLTIRVATVETGGEAALLTREWHTVFEATMETLAKVSLLAGRVACERAMHDIKRVKIPSSVILARHLGDPITHGDEKGYSRWYDVECERDGWIAVSKRGTVRWLPSYFVLKEKHESRVVLPPVGINCSLRSFAWVNSVKDVEYSDRCEQHASMLRSLVKRIGRSLTALHLPNSWLQAGHAARILQACPNLTELNLSGNRINSVVTLVNEFKRGACKITSLSLHQRSSLTTQMALQLTGLLRSRHQAGSRQDMAPLLRLAIAAPPVFMRNRQLYQDFLAAVRGAIDTGRVGEYLRVHYSDERVLSHDSAGVIAAHHPTPHRQLPLKAKLAVLSVIDAGCPRTALRRLDTVLLAQIFAYAGSYRSLRVELTTDAHFSSD